MARYRLAGSAEQDLLDIWLYSAANWSVEQAERMLGRLQRRFESLAEQPYQGIQRPEVDPRARSVVVGNFVVFYEPIEDGILVLRVTHGRRDPGVQGAEGW